MKTLDLYFRFANDADMEKIYNWLVDHERRGVDGLFLCNWELTQNVYKEGNIIVAILNGEPIAYMWTDFGIVEVREDYRRKGIGRQLVRYALELARKSNAVCIDIECAPYTSIPFWEKIGFRLYGENRAYLLLERQLSLPANGEPICVKIRFYPESRMWEGGTTPLEEFSPPAVMGPDGIICLGKRIAVCARRDIWDGDVVLGIEISGNNLYLDKAKRREAENLGVQYKNGTYFIERINA